MDNRILALTSESVGRIFDELLNYTYDGVVINGEDGTVLFVNNAYSRITGIPKEAVVGKTSFQLIQKGYSLAKLIERVHSLKRPITSLVDYKDSREILVTVIPVFGEDGAFLGTVGNLRDMTDLNRLIKRVTRSENYNEDEKKKTRELLSRNLGNMEIVERSQEMLSLLQLAVRVAKVDATVLITGESGVGKDVYARLVHRLGQTNPARPFVKITCAAIPETLLESELFGYEAGAFTGAKREGKPGAFELAGNGTVFLDEIGELPLSLQAKLLTVLQDRKFARLGSVREVKMAARIIAATNKDLLAEVKKGEFRSDLYYRLNVIPIHIPPLRNRREDILPIAGRMLSRINEKYKARKTFDDKSLALLEAYDWPGNIREMENLLERLVVVIPDDTIRAEHLPADMRKGQLALPLPAAVNKPLKNILEEVEAEILARTLKERTTLQDAADALGIDISTLVRKIDKYDLPKRYKTKFVHKTAKQAKK